MSTAHRGRKAQSYRGAMSQWRAKKKAAGKWTAQEMRCVMILADGTPEGQRCPNEAAGPFGYCSSCWNLSA